MGGSTVDWVIVGGYLVDRLVCWLIFWDECSGRLNCNSDVRCTDV